MLSNKNKKKIYKKSSFLMKLMKRKIIVRHNKKHENGIKIVVEIECNEMSHQKWNKCLVDHRKKSLKMMI